MIQVFRSTRAVGQTTAQGELLSHKTFNYASLDADIAQEVLITAQRIRQRVYQTLEVLIAVGNDLIAVKQILPHGHFGPWLRGEFGWAERTARNFMIVAQRFGPKTAIIADLRIDPTAAYLLAAPSAPQEASEVALQRAESGEQITVSVAKEILDSFREPKRRERTSSDEQPTGKLWGQLLEVLESFRQQWDHRQVFVLARQLRDFADSLEKM